MKNKQNIVSKSSIITLFIVLLFSFTVRLLFAPKSAHNKTAEQQKTVTFSSQKSIKTNETALKGMKDTDRKFTIREIVK